MFFLMKLKQLVVGRLRIRSLATCKSAFKERCKWQLHSATCINTFLRIDKNLTEQV